MSDYVSQKIKELKINIKLAYDQKKIEKLHEEKRKRDDYKFFTNNFYNQIDETKKLVNFLNKEIILNNDQKLKHYVEYDGLYVMYNRGFFKLEYSSFADEVITIRQKYGGIPSVDLFSFRRKEAAGHYLIDCIINEFTKIGEKNYEKIQIQSF